MESNTLITLIWIVAFLLMAGGGTQVVRLCRGIQQTQRRTIPPPRVSVQYEHILSEREVQDELWKTYSKRVIEACVETWLSTTGRGADLNDYRKWIQADQRLTAEPGIVLTRTTPQFEAGTVVFLTMRPDSSALPALDGLLAHMEYWRGSSSVLPKDTEDVTALYFIEEQE